MTLELNKDSKTFSVINQLYKGDDRFWYRLRQYLQAREWLEVPIDPKQIPKTIKTGEWKPHAT